MYENTICNNDTGVIKNYTLQCNIECIKQKLLKIQWEINRNTIGGGDYNTIFIGFNE